MEICKLLIILSLVLITSACEDSESPKSKLAISSIQQPAPSTFDMLHNFSEAIYDGNGTWGVNEYGYQMELRDSYWRADVYSEIAARNPQKSVIYLQRAEQVNTYLRLVQMESGGQVFGAPADINNPEFGSIVSKIIADCPECILNGRVISLPGEKIAELYYDHGNALTTLAKQYKRRQDKTLLQVIIAAADWSLDKPLHSNINYLSALSKGLSYAYEITNDIRYLNRSVFLHEQGILPFLSTDNGSAMDAHNQQLEYHGFIVSGLVALARIIPDEHVLAIEVRQVTELAVAHMQQRNISESAEYGATWPGTNLLAWFELSQIRELTFLELRAKQRCIDLINSYADSIEADNGFRLQKAIYSNFSVGLFVLP